MTMVSCWDLLPPYRVRVLKSTLVFIYRVLGLCLGSNHSLPCPCLLLVVHLSPPCPTFVLGASFSLVCPGDTLGPSPSFLCLGFLLGFVSPSTASDLSISAHALSTVVGAILAPRLTLSCRDFVVGLRRHTVPGSYT